MPVSKCGQNGRLDRSQLVVGSWRPFDVSVIKQILMYIEMIFGKNKEQTMRQLQFKFDLFSTKSTAICLFHQWWIKTFYTQPFGQLCIKYFLVFQKFYLVQFCNKYMVGPSQKKLILGTRKMIKNSQKDKNACKLAIIQKMWSNLKEKFSCADFQNIFDRCFTKHPQFQYLETILNHKFSEPIRAHPTDHPPLANLNRPFQPV